MLRNTALQDLVEKMEILTPAQRKVADYILKYPMEAAFLTIEQLARLTSVSVATIIRLTYSLEYEGYTQFQKDLQALLRDQISPPNRLEANLKRIGKNKLLIKCAELQIQNIRTTVEILSEENIISGLPAFGPEGRFFLPGHVRSHCLAAGRAKRKIDGLRRIFTITPNDYNERQDRGRCEC